MRKVRFSIAQKCLLLVFLALAILGAFHIHEIYSSRKKDFLINKKDEALFALSIIKGRVELIKKDMLTIVNDLTKVFHIYNPTHKEITELLKTFLKPALITGGGYIEPPGKNSYRNYIYMLSSGELVVSDIEAKIPDYQTHPWFVVPEKTKRPFVETPTVDKVSGFKNYMITFSYPYIDVNGKFKGVFVFDVEAKWLTYDLNEYIKDEELDISMFFPKENGNGKIEFIKSTRINCLSNNKLLNNFMTEIMKGKGKPLNITGIYGDSKVIGYAFSMFNNSVFGMTTFDESIIENQLKSILYKNLIIGVISLAVLFIVLFWAIKHSVKPVEEIANKVKNIAKGDFNTDLSIKSGPVEVLALNEAIKKMQLRIKRYIVEIRKTTELNTEMKIAAKIQKSLIPKPCLKLDNFPDIDFYQFLKPAKDASGDFYDYYMLDDENLFLSIGDVTGKGIPASLFTVLMLSMEKLYPEIPISMSDTLTMVNKKIVPINEMNIFISYFCMVLNLKTGVARYANAGHDSPFIRKKDGTVFQLKQGKGTFLGIFENTEYTEEYYRFEAGDSILIYTDGVTEAMNSASNMFGSSRTVCAIKSVNTEFSAKEIIDKVVKEIKHFTDGHIQSDDICMICLKYK